MVNASTKSGLLLVRGREASRPAIRFPVERFCCFSGACARRVTDLAGHVVPQVRVGYRACVSGEDPRGSSCGCERESAPKERQADKV